MADFTITSEQTRQDVLAHIAALDLDKPHKVTVKKQGVKRTLSQSALLHMWFDVIAKDTGDSPEDVKDALCERFLGLRERIILGQRVMVRKSTADLEKPEMTGLMEQVYALAVEFNIYLPVPEDMHMRNGRQSA